MTIDAPPTSTRMYSRRWKHLTVVVYYAVLIGYEAGYLIHAVNLPANSANQASSIAAANTFFGVMAVLPLMTWTGSRSNLDGKPYMYWLLEKLVPFELVILLNLAANLVFPSFQSLAIGAKGSNVGLSVTTLQLIPAGICLLGLLIFLVFYTRRQKVSV